MASIYVNSLNAYAAPKFTPDQQNLLLKYFTNIDLPVYAFTKNVPTEVAGALISRFSRSDKSPRELFLEEFLKNPDLNISAEEIKNEGEEAAKERAAKFFQNVLAKYGDESVAEMTGVYIIIEKASLIALKVIESMRRMAFIEQSTRYIDLSQKIDGKYPYFRDKKLIEKIGSDYEKVADKLYYTYDKSFELVREHVTQQNPIASDDTEGGYKQAVHSRTCDILRELFPIGMRATVGVFGFGRDWSDLVNLMFTHPLDEIEALGQMIMTEVAKIIPNIMSRTSGDHGQMTRTFYRTENKIVKDLSQSTALNFLSKRNGFHTHEKISAKIKSISADAMESICAGVMYGNSDLPFDTLLEYFRLNPHKTENLLKEITLARKSRFDKVPNGFEKTKISVEFTAPWSCWKDIQRHRRLSEFHNTYFINSGFYSAPELEQMGLEKEYSQVMNDTLDFIQHVADMYPEYLDNIEYLVPQGAIFRWTMDMDFAEAVYMIELRSAAAGHMVYRQLMHEFYRELVKYNADLGHLVKFVDMNEYYLGRRQSYNKVIQKGASLE